MNDNKDEARGVEVHLLAYFRTDRKLFEFYSCLPDFITVKVYDRRIERGEARRFTIQIVDKQCFLHVTEYRFHVP